LSGSRPFCNCATLSSIKLAATWPGLTRRRVVLSRMAISLKACHVSGRKPTRRRIVHAGSEGRPARPLVWSRFASSLCNWSTPKGPCGCARTGSARSAPNALHTSSGLPDIPSPPFIVFRPRVNPSSRGGGTRAQNAPRSRGGHTTVGEKLGAQILFRSLLQDAPAAYFVHVSLARYTPGLMFWFSRKKLVGSYFCFSWASRP